MRFSEACLLLTGLEDIELRDPPFIHPKEKSLQIKQVTEHWFKSHRRTLNSLDIDNSVALLSTFLPERRTDRVYGIQAVRLCKILSRCLNLSAARTRDLRAYERPGCGDLGQCLERVLKAGGPPARPPVELREIDELIEMLAGGSQFSGPAVVRLPSGSSEARDKAVGNVFKRLEPHEAKWMARLILKDFSPVRVSEWVLLHSFHFLLPDLLKFQDSFRAAIELLKGSLKNYPEAPDPRSEDLHRMSVKMQLRPAVGIKVARPEFAKARSIEHCMKMLDGKKWVLERKYDGEYCEIHIDRSKSMKVEECITIFSKSGKDSTRDRFGIHKTLIDCLSLGKPDCKIKQKAILLGEMVVYSDTYRKTLPFDQIRKHVLRSGRAIGTDNDSPIQRDEHLAIVLFDILLLDDKIIMTKSIEERRDYLREIYDKIPGKAWSTEWKTVDFSNTEIARKRLAEQFAASIVERCEGLLLKPCDVPYFPFGETEDRNEPRYIKLKKDFILGLGDEADFAVVGGSYNPQQASKSGIKGLQWTEFHLGCLTNKVDVLRFEARPSFKIVGSIQQDQCIPKPILEAANTIAKFVARPYNKSQPPANFDLEHDGSSNIDHVFDTPLVFEVLGSGFEKPSNCNFHMLRHPRVKKLHEDRSWRDCVSFQELQAQASTARNNGEESESQETRCWLEKLERKLRRKSERRASATPGSDIRSTPATGRSTVRSADTSAGQSSHRRSELDGTTLIEDTAPIRKRPRASLTAATPCPAPKKRCTEAIPASPPKQRGRDTSTIKTTPARPGPLSEIPNNAVQGPSTTTSSKQPPSSPSHHTSTENKQAPPEPIAKDCLPTDCPLREAVIYLPPSLRATTHLSTLLLNSYDALIIPTLDYWDRDSLAHPRLTETVSESQAYGDRRKIALIDRRTCHWKTEFRGVMAGIGELNGGCFRERVEFWDVDILQKGRCGHGGMGSGSFLGHTCFVEGEGEGRVKFVPRRRARQAACGLEGAALPTDSSLIEVTVV